MSIHGFSSRLAWIMIARKERMMYETTLRRVAKLSLEKSDRIRELEAENERLRNWVADCQSGMYINCVYCGHRYGPDDEVPSTMADILKEHIEQCPDHPMSALKSENERLTKHVDGRDYNLQVRADRIANLEVEVQRLLAENVELRDQLAKYQHLAEGE